MGGQVGETSMVVLSRVLYCVSAAAVVPKPRTSESAGA